MLRSIQSTTSICKRMPKFNFRFSCTKSQSQQNTSKKDHLTWNTVLLKKPHSLCKPQLSEHLEIHAPETKPKTFLTLQIFQQTSGWCQKKHRNCTISRCPGKTLWKQMSVYFCISPSENFCSRDVVSFYLVLYFNCWIICLRRLTVWASQNVLQFFILVKIFGNSAIFQSFDTSICNIKTLKFSQQFRL